MGGKSEALNWQHWSQDLNAGLVDSYAFPLYLLLSPEETECFLLHVAAERGEKGGACPLLLICSHNMQSLQNLAFHHYL